MDADTPVGRPPLGCRHPCRQTSSWMQTLPGGRPPPWMQTLPGGRPPPWMQNPTCRQSPRMQTRPVGRPPLGCRHSLEADLPLGCRHPCRQSSPWMQSAYRGVCIQGGGLPPGSVCIQGGGLPPGSVCIQEEVCLQGCLHPRGGLPTGVSASKGEVCLQGVSASKRRPAYRACLHPRALPTGGVGADPAESEKRLVRTLLECILVFCTYCTISSLTTLPWLHSE